MIPEASESGSIAQTSDASGVVSGPPSQSNNRKLFRFHADESGQVSFLLVFMMLCLATLIFFVFNTGDQVNQAVMAQNSADSAALAGANWLAHGYNILAANNVASSRIIALISMLESIGPSVQLALPNAQKILPVIQDYPNQLPDRNSNGDVPDAILARALVGPIQPADCHGAVGTDPCESLLEECQHCIDKLNELQAVITRLDEHYSDRGGFPAALTKFDSGDLWQALRALQAYSDTVVEITPGMAQRRAYEVGRGNYSTTDRLTFAALLPIVPDFPVLRGTWSDYYDPVMSGLPPGWQPVMATADTLRGGYHTLMAPQGYWPPYTFRDAIQVGSAVGHETEEEGENPGERRGDPNQQHLWVPQSIQNWVAAQFGRDEIMRLAKGPYKVYRDDIADLLSGAGREMRLSGFPIIFDRVSYAVMQAIWNTPLATIPIPRWETDYINITRPPSFNDRGGLLAQGVNCAMSAWLGTRRNSHDRFSDDPLGKPTGQPWRIDDEPSPPKNDWIWPGWIDPTEFLSLQNQWVWWGQLRVRTFTPQKFGASPNQFPPDGYEPPDLGPNGQPSGVPYWLFWRWRKWLFVGALFDTETYTMPDLSRLAGDKSAFAPYNLDPRGNYAAKNNYGSYETIAYAYRPGAARMWGRPLHNPTPLAAPDSDGRFKPVNLAYAQARVYNPSGWDLWTQDWRVKLVPATHLLDAAASTTTLAQDLQRYHQFDPAIDEDQLRPIVQFYDRVPRDPAVLDEITNH